ncbi:3'-5' exonuclease [Prochlorococcus sp. MIT 1300]|uniref:3'-5' exonuclease n=1 Tax=Prochlorococcus sp. MIT 1300 TaxID=3096218 RepID=UPI0039BED493
MKNLDAYGRIKRTYPGNDVEEDQRNSSSGEQLHLLDGCVPELNSRLQPSYVIDQKSASNSGKPMEQNFPEMLLILDTETTGLDPLKDQCLEIGAILFSVSSRSTLAQQSFLIPVDENSAEGINQIPASITNLRQPWRKALSYFQDLVDTADLLVAHNVDFDRKWFGREPLPKLFKPWLCTMEDICWPADRHLRRRPSVRDLALSYGVPVWAAHRALTDCIYLAEVFKRCDDLELLIEHGLEPKKLVKALVSYEERQLARTAGFRWNDPVQGAWTLRLSAREIKNLAFPVAPLEPWED